MSLKLTMQNPMLKSFFLQNAVMNYDCILFAIHPALVCLFFSSAYELQLSMSHISHIFQSSILCTTKDFSDGMRQAFALLFFPQSPQDNWKLFNENIAKESFIIKENY